MKTRNRIALIALLIVGFALPASANTWSNCSGGTTGDGITVKGFEMLCFDFTSTGVDSRIFRVASKTALICFDPALDSAGGDVAQIYIRYCPNGAKPSSSPQNECVKVTSSPMVGAEGGPGTQDACLQVGPGVYFVDITTVPAGGDNARVTIQGQGDK